jgi:hypothetical protein
MKRTDSTPATDPKQYVMGGNATFTLESLKTGTHFTFRVRKPEDKAVAFVQLLAGPENTADYNYLGYIKTRSGEYRHGGKKTNISTDAPSAKGFDWFWKHIDHLPADAVKFHPSGKCCRCGRKLTTPESVERGIGPECAGKL